MAVLSIKLRNVGTQDELLPGIHIFGTPDPCCLPADGEQYEVYRDPSSGEEVIGYFVLAYNKSLRAARSRGTVTVHETHDAEGLKLEMGDTITVQS